MYNSNEISSLPSASPSASCMGPETKSGSDESNITSLISLPVFRKNREYCHLHGSFCSKLQKSPVLSAEQYVVIIITDRETNTCRISTDITVKHGRMASRERGREKNFANILCKFRAYIAGGGEG